MKHLSLSRSSRLAAGAAVAGLALVLSACSGGSGDSSNGDVQKDGKPEAQPTEESMRQLNEDELADVLNGVEHDGAKFKAIDTETAEIKDAMKMFEQADIEPAACKDVMISLMTKPAADAPTKAATGEKGYTAAITSFKTEDEATTALQDMVDANSQCKDMTMTVAGQSIKMSVKVEDIDVPGASKAVQTVATTPIAPDDEHYTVSAVVKNGVVTGTAMQQSTSEKSVGVATDVAKAYAEAVK